MMEDKTLICKECGEEFFFGGGERKFFEAKGLKTPLRCKPCRQKRKETIDRRTEGENERNDQNKL